MICFEVQPKHLLPIGQGLEAMRCKIDQDWLARKLYGVLILAISVGVKVASLWSPRETLCTLCRHQDWGSEPCSVLLVRNGPSFRQERAMM